jgi:outer membrane protein
MTKGWWSLLLALICSGCTRDAFDPFTLAPSSSRAMWSPLEGNRLISSKYCQTVLPENFRKGELSLAELLDIGLQNNPTTKQTWAQARAAAGSFGQSLSSYYPNIKFNGTYTRQRFSAFSIIDIGPVVMQYATEATPDIQVTYTLLDFGVRSSAAEAARQALYYADWTHNQQVQNVLQIILHDYYNYLYQKALYRNTEVNVEHAQATLDAANQKFALGIVALGDVASARTQFLQSKINLTSQKQAVENAFAQLAADLGLPADLPFDVQPMPEQVSPDPLLEGIEILVERAQKQRQDLLAAEANVRSKEASLKNARAQVLPVVKGSFDTGHYWFNKGLQEKGLHWTAMLSVTFPIFNGFFYRNGMRVAKANLEYAQAQMLQTELSIIQNVTTAHLGVKTSAQNLRDSQEYLRAAELEFDIALKSYKAGTTTLLDVLSAQASLADARARKAYAEYEWFNALAAIAYATGALCSPTICTESECDRSF